jgi:hypothetical protein
MVTTRQVGQSVAAPQGRGVPAPVGPGGPGAGTTPAEAGVFSIYNWTLGSWEPLAGGQEQVRLETAAPYVTQGGQVWVQVTAAADRAVRFIVPELTIEGTVR